MLHLKEHLLVRIKYVTEDSSQGLPKGLFWGLHKDAQEGAFEIEIEGVLEETKELHLKMCMVVHLLKLIQ